MTSTSSGATCTDITAVVLAGGRARRMGGEDKGLIALGDKPMVAHVVSALKPQVGAILISANRNANEYARVTQCRIVADTDDDFAGPLAGMASAMAVADTTYVMRAPCDSPLIGSDLAILLRNALRAHGAALAVAHDGERMQPVFALLQRDLLSNLRDYLASGERKIDRWYAQHAVAEVDFSDRLDTFTNINTPEERARMEARIARGESDT